MAATLTKQQAADAVAVARDEREIIQANLLDLDGSFGRELLWTAPCDLAAAADAVNRFQQAVLAIGAQQL